MLNRDTNRVLSRIQAREMTPEETGKVKGGINPNTDTVCTFTPPNFLDGDPGECS